MVDEQERESFVRGPFPRPVMRGKGPVRGAYLATGALDRACPHCHQPVGEFCVHDEDGEVPRRMPCPERMDRNTDRVDGDGAR